jgi:hypothetical protein
MLNHIKYTSSYEDSFFLSGIFRAIGVQGKEFGIKHAYIEIKYLGQLGMESQN